MAFDLKYHTRQVLSSQWFMYVSLVAVLLSAVTWLGAFILGPHHVSDTLRVYHYNQIHDYYHSSKWPDDCLANRYYDTPLHWRFDWCGSIKTPEDLDKLIHKELEETLDENVRYQSRKEIQRPASRAFLISLLVFGLSWLYRPLSQEKHYGRSHER